MFFPSMFGIACSKTGFTFSPDCARPGEPPSAIAVNTMPKQPVRITLLNVLAGTHESSTASDGFSALHDVLAEGADDVHQLLMLSYRHLVLVKGLREVANNNVEVGVGDPEPGVHRLRRTADHLAWAPGNVAHQVLVLLFET